MGPRKNNAAAAGKDDGAALGKMRKIMPAGSASPAIKHNTTNTNTTTTTSSSSGAVPAVELPYSAEERAFLEAQLAYFNTDKSAGASGSPVTKEHAALSRERWVAGLPLLLSATEKLLRLAAEQYQITCRNRGAAAAAHRTAGGSSPAPAPTAFSSSGMSGNADSVKGGLNGTLSMTDNGLASAAPGLRPTPAAGTVAQFTEENAYILAQAQQLQWFPFTYQRWLELLLDPGRCHTAKDECRLRGDAVQASLRRCILVTYPALEGGDCI